MDRPMVNSGELLWTGQHWINYLRPVGHPHHSAMVSLWHTHYCDAGEGTVAFIKITGITEYICTDNHEIAAYIRNWMKGRGGLYDMDLPVVDGVFSRDGDIRGGPIWNIETEGDQIAAIWEDLLPPVFLEAPAPKFQPDKDVYSCLIFADSARIILNDQLIPGKPYPTNKWASSIGGDRSSCVFALSETFILRPMST